MTFSIRTWGIRGAIAYSFFTFILLFFQITDLMTVLIFTFIVALVAGFGITILWLTGRVGSHQPSTRPKTKGYLTELGLFNLFKEYLNHDLNTHLFLKPLGSAGDNYQNI